MAIFAGDANGAATNDTILPGFLSANVVSIPAGSVVTAADDILIGQGGNDVLNGGFGADFLIGGAGIDTANYLLSPAAVTVNLFTHVGAGAGSHAFGDLLFQIENVIGSNFNDTITGDDLANSLSGVNGFDTLNGGNGNDRLSGGNDDDRLFGGNNNDQLFGDNNNDRLFGGNDNDQLFGGAGNDTLNGDNGNDIVNGGDGNDVVNGGSGTDIVNGGNGNDVLTGAFGNDNLTGFGGAAAFDRFDYNSVNDSLPGAANRDVITDFIGNGVFNGDVIDLSTIDANPFAAGDQAFTFIFGNNFTPLPGELHYQAGILAGNTDFDAAPEFEIQLVGAPALVVGAFAGSDVIL